MIYIWALIILYCVYWGIKRAKLETAMMPPAASKEKPGRIYFLQHQNNPDRIKIVKSPGELATPLRVVHEVNTPTPNAVLSAIYRDLEESHQGAGWYDADAVRMYLDHLRGVA